MYKREIDMKFTKKDIPNYILLRGNDEFQIEFYADMFLKFWNKNNVLKIFYDEYNFEQIYNFLQPSLFEDSNVVYIKTDKTIPTKELKTLINMCKNSQNNFLIYELLEDTSKIKNDFLMIFEGNFVRFFKPSNISEAINLLSQKCQLVGINPNFAALEKIYKIHNENLGLSANEIDKFASLGLEMNLDNVNALVFGLSDVNFETIFNKIINLQDFKNELFTYMQSGSYNELMFINYLYNAFARLFKIYSYIKINGRLSCIDVLGYNPPINIAKNLESQALRLSNKLIKNIFLILNDVDFTIKTKSDINKTDFLISSLLKIQFNITKK